MTPSTAVGVALVALSTSVAAHALLIPILRRSGVMDIPGHRSSHVTSTPRGAGLAVIAALAIALAGAADMPPGIRFPAVGVGLLAATGFVDDIRGLSARSRLVMQTVAASLMIFPLGLEPAIAVVGVVVICAYVNAFNFMDGINGISGASSTIFGVHLHLIGLSLQDLLLSAIGLAVAGSCLGFLFFNVPCAKIFLGDVGSYALGGILAAATIYAWTIDATWQQLLAAPLLYLADTGVTLVRRLRAGENIFEPHRAHTYQRLVTGGLSHVQATAIVGVATTVLVASSSLPSAHSSIWWTILATFVVITYLFSPRLLNRSGRTQPKTEHLESEQ